MDSSTTASPRATSNLTQAIVAMEYARGLIEALRAEAIARREYCGHFFAAGHRLDAAIGILAAGSPFAAPRPASEPDSVAPNPAPPSGWAI